MNILLSVFLAVFFSVLTALINLTGYQMEQYPCLGGSFGWPVGFYHGEVGYGQLAMPGCQQYFNLLGFVIDILFWFVLSLFVLSFIRWWRRRIKTPSS